MRSFPTYLKITVAIPLCGLALLFLCNLIIDPEDRFHLVSIPGFNQEKTAIMEGGGRVVKAVALEQGEYDTVILGSSRSENGLDPHYPAFGTRRVYNAALQGSNFYETSQVFTFAKNTGHLKTVILGLDFLLFSDKRKVAGDFLDSRFAGANRWLSDLKYLASPDTLSSSIQTVQDNRAGRKSRYTAQGMRGRPPLADEGRINHRDLFIKILTRNFLVSEETYGAFSYGPDRLEMFRSVVARCRTEGIELHVFIPPGHARDLEALRVLGLYPLFEQWKRDLVSVLAADAAQHPDTKPLQLWDFTGYSTLTTEDVPLATEKGKPMQWYWESSHFKKETGDLVLDRLFDYHEPGHAVPGDFGVLITPENLEAHLALIRAQQKRYFETYPREVAEVEYLAKITERFRAPREMPAEAISQRESAGHLNGSHEEATPQPAIDAGLIRQSPR